MASQSKLPNCFACPRTMKRWKKSQGVKWEENIPSKRSKSQISLFPLPPPIFPSCNLKPTFPPTTPSQLFFDPAFHVLGGVQMHSEADASFFFYF